MLYGVLPFATDMGQLNDIESKIKNGFQLPEVVGTIVTTPGEA